MRWRYLLLKWQSPAIADGASYGPGRLAVARLQDRPPEGVLQARRGTNAVEREQATYTQSRRLTQGKPSAAFTAERTARMTSGSSRNTW
jgi:hypothetical protein